MKLDLDACVDHGDRATFFANISPLVPIYNPKQTFRQEDGPFASPDGINWQPESLDMTQPNNLGAYHLES